MPFPEPLKVRIRRRADFSCCLCHKLGVEIHHIVPQNEGGDDEEDNAAPLCPSCHEVYGANPIKRAFIREARDCWYDICVKRFAPESGRLEEMNALLKNAVSKTDLDNAIAKIDAVIRAQQDQNLNGDIASAVPMLSSVVESLYFIKKLATAQGLRRKICVMMAVSQLSKDIQEKWLTLGQWALKHKLDAIWIEELAAHAISGGGLEKRLLEESSMSEEAFVGYLDGVVERDMQSAANQPDISLEGLSTADAEWVQAAQAPPDLLKQWRAAPEDQRPFLMAGWISEGKVRRIHFDYGEGAGSESPGYFYMRKGRDLLLEGKKQEGFALIRAAIILDPIAAEGLALWFALAGNSAKIGNDPEVLTFMVDLYGHEKVELMKKMKAGV
jgi:hypothetical protein